jgi:hypothetical protein
VVCGQATFTEHVPRVEALRIDEIRRGTAK